MEIIGRLCWRLFNNVVNDELKFLEKFEYYIFWLNIDGDIGVYLSVFCIRDESGVTLWYYLEK